MTDHENPHRRPQLTLIKGGRDRDRILEEIIDEVMKPQPVDEERIDELRSQLDSRGQLHSVDRLMAEDYLEHLREAHRHINAQDLAAQEEVMPKLPNGGWYLGMLSPEKLSEIFRRRRRVMKAARLVFRSWPAARDWLWGDHPTLGQSPIIFLQTEEQEIALMKAISAEIPRQRARAVKPFLKLLLRRDPELGG